MKSSGSSRHIYESHPLNQGFYHTRSAAKKLRPHGFSVRPFYITLEPNILTGKSALFSILTPKTVPLFSLRQPPLDRRFEVVAGFLQVL